MKRITINILLIVTFLGLTGCIVRDDATKYQKKEIQISEEIDGLEVLDKSSNIQILTSDTKEISVQYSDFIDEQLYAFEVNDNILKVVKKSSTVNLEMNNIVIKLPKKKYNVISVTTTNGDIDLNGIEATVYKCNTENGNIRGGIGGKKEEYAIAIETKNGTSNLEDTLIKSENMLEMQTRNGDIYIQFMEE